jgi:DNA-directed RNA polymerase specialized sigma24 family protein
LSLDVRTLRELFRNLKQWRSLYESEQLDTIASPDGDEYCLWDIESLYGQIDTLPKRQYQAIELYLVQNMKEAEAAVKMGVSATNPIGIYASVGLQKLINMAEAGLIPGYRVG